MLNGVHTAVADYLVDPTLIGDLDGEQLASLIGQCEQLKALCWGRLVALPHQDKIDLQICKPKKVSSAATLSDLAITRDAGPKDRWLRTREAAAMLRRTPSWIYRNADRLPFVKRLGPKSPLLCSEQGIQRYLHR
jgi:hypothetical protein